ncbi:Crp/Fnr family transcriptional regulator [Neptunicoccus sediminis]|uniref:Crp/Fnr family transcriptional regulator n=1 Tax=Neptunicoccus sediminis TaxID=1892596 RepID=UPI0009F4807F|nr:Crp/Fnr family transcriptional regulator [Neptunicoccus sediminis]
MQRNELTFPSTSFLGRLSDESWNELSSLWTVKMYRARHFLISADDKDSMDVYFVIDGSIRATVYTDAGREVSLLTFSNGDCIGEFSALDEAPRSSDAIAERDSIIARISPEKFRTLVRKNPDLSYTLLMLLVGHLRRLSKRVIDFNAKSADERLRDAILDLVEKRVGSGDSVLIDRPPTQSELAAVVFSSRESVAREMGRMRKAGVLLRVKRSLHIPSVAKLRDYVEDAAP